MKIFSLVVVLMSVMALAFTSNANAQAALCSQVIFTDCTGACGPGNLPATITAPQTGTYILSATSSLCGTSGLVLKASVNGRDYRKICSTNSCAMRFKARKGASITINVGPKHFDPDIVCIWAGEQHTTLCLQ